MEIAVLLFEDRDNEGTYQAGADNVLGLGPGFRLDFNTAFPSGPARPHGVAFK
jgi:hypothetical protein